MSTISNFTPLCETAGSAAKRTSVGLRNCTPNCPPNCPECGQVNFKGDELYLSYNKERKKKRNTALLTSVCVLALGAASMIGLGKMHNSKWVANLKDGWFKNGMESATRGCDNACKFVKNKAVGAWNWVKGKWPFGKNS